MHNAFNVDSPEKIMVHAQTFDLWDVLTSEIVHVSDDITAHIHDAQSIRTKTVLIKNPANLVHFKVVGS